MRYETSCRCARHSHSHSRSHQFPRTQSYISLGKKFYIYRHYHIAGFLSNLRFALPILFLFLSLLFPKCKKTTCPTNNSMKCSPVEHCSFSIVEYDMMACIHLKNNTSMRSILHTRVADDYILCRWFVMLPFNPTDRFKISKTQENRPKNVIVSKSMNAHSKLRSVSTAPSPISP